MTSFANVTLPVRFAEQYWPNMPKPGNWPRKENLYLKVADVQHLFLRAYITADQLSQLKLGDKVKVFSDLGKDDRREYEGTITWISDKSEFTPKTIQTRDERANLVYATKIAVKNDGYIKIGMYGEMKK